MFILDTNIVSEVMRNIPSTEVMAWLDERPIHDLYVTAVTQAEILTGIAFLPEGRRRSELTKATEHAFNSLFNGRLLPFDSVGRTCLRRNCFSPSQCRATDISV